MISSAQFRALALDLPGSSEAAHFDRIAFKVARIFATLATDRPTATVKLPREIQELKCLMAPDLFQPAAGGFGRLGWTIVDLAAIGRDELAAVLKIAWGGAQLDRREQRKASRGVRAPGGGREAVSKPRKQRDPTPPTPEAEAKAPAKRLAKRPARKGTVGTRKSDGTADKAVARRSKGAKAAKPTNKRGGKRR